MKKTILIFVFSAISLLANNFYELSMNGLMDIKDLISDEDKNEYKKEVLNRVGIMSIDEKKFFKEYINKEENISH